MSDISEKQYTTTAIDLTHHISDYAKRFSISPLKGLQKYYGKDIISFAGGTPNPAVFPFSEISAKALVPDSFSVAPKVGQESPTTFSWLWRLFGYDPSKERTTPIVVTKPASEGDNGLNLSTALQYGPATGLAETQRFIQEFSELVFRPAYSNFTTLVHTGNTDAWGRCARVLLNPGDTVIAEEWTYPSALATSAPIVINILPVPIDGIGMRADALRELLANWDDSKGKRPHVMYTVPIGQNPSGATMDVERKKAIYDVCVEFDVVIVEDDPYYFLQMNEYVSRDLRGKTSVDSVSDDNQEFIKSLAPSFLSIDTQGRVIRLDTFSKTIAPGMRLGWFTCAPLFAERFERVGETSTQSPCGMGQALAMQLMKQWTLDGYLRWLRGIRAQYTARRDYFVDTLAETFDLESRLCTQGIWAGAKVYTAYMKPRGGYLMREKAVRKALFEFVPPTAGMFVWIKLNFKNHPRRLRGEPEDEGTLEMKYWTQLAEAGVLTAPGWFFSAHLEHDGTEPDYDSEGHLRMSFSMATTGEMQRGIGLFEKTLRQFFEV